MPIIWLTGQPGAGKTSISREIINNRVNHKVHNIDGDDIRDYFQNQDYSETGRRSNVKLAQDIAYFLHRKGELVLVSLVSPYRDQREQFKKKLGDQLAEVWVHTTQKRGRENFWVANYEEPQENFIYLDTTNKTVEESVELLENLLMKSINFY